MRIVADTNIIISGLLWHGSPRQVLDLAREGLLELFISPVLLVELEEVLMRDKFAQRLTMAGLIPQDLITGYIALATVIMPAQIAPVIREDPDDDHVLACAVAVHAEAIVSGDSHLLALKIYRDIRIVTAAELLRWVNQQ